MEEDHGVRFWDDNEAYSLIKEAAKCICISKSVMSKFAPLIGGSKCALIPNGISIDDYLCLKAPFRLPYVEITVCGNFEPGKGQIEAIEAIGQLIKKRPDLNIHLNIIGQHFKKEYTDAIDCSIKKSGIESLAYTLGAIGDMPAFWAHTDIAIVPSRFEAFGRCTVEAMLSSAVVVGANTAGTAELIEDGVTGFLYEQGDPTDLARVLDHVVSSPDLAFDVATVAREFARISYSSEANAKKIFELHKKVLKEKSLSEKLDRH